MRTLSRTKSEGRFARSVEMITQRPVTGSLRSSGNASLLAPPRVQTRGAKALSLSTYFSAASRRRKGRGAGASLTIGKGAAMKANDRRNAGRGFDGQHVEAARRLADAALGQELAGHAREQAALFGRDGVLGQAARGALAGARLHFDKGEHRAVIANEVELSLESGYGEVARDDRVAVAP